MNRQVTIREATIYDAGTIADLSRSTFYDTFASDNTEENMIIFMSRQFTRDALLAEVGIRSNLFFLAYCDGELAGYVKLRESKGPPELKEVPTMEIARLYVVKSMLGKGIGRALMKYSLDIARSRQKKAVWLAVWEKNERAMRFYTQWGFTTFSKQVFVLGTDLQNDWIMKKEL
ncbi:MAG: GNAT family N-acetyltransferase [Williamsia sp.]|nr:GNAT family N-acetyltransferase [Williamsia sp.]